MVRRVITSTFTEPQVQEFIKKSAEIVKGGKTKKAETLLKPVKKTKVKVDDVEAEIADDAETVLKIDKKKFKVKKPEVTEQASDLFKYDYKNSKIPPKVLSDFNINRINSKEDILRLIELTSQKFKSSIDAQKRGVQTNTATKRLATLVGKNEKKLAQTLLNLQPGDTLNAEYILAARELLVAGMTKLDELAEAAVKGGDAENLAFRQHMALMSEYQKIIKGVQTETARALQSFRIPTRTKSFTNVNLDELNRENLLIELGGIEDSKTVAEFYLKRAGSQEAKLKLVDDVGVLKLKAFSEGIAESFINIILSNPITHLRNTGGNWITQALNNFERKVASKLYGEDEIGGIAKYEDIAKVYGMTMANDEMIKALATTFKQKPLSEIVKTFDQQIPSNFGGSKIEIRPGKFTAAHANIQNEAIATGYDMAGKLLTLGRIPTRMLTVADNYFKNREYRSELYALAFRETMDQIDRGILAVDDAADYLADRVYNPTKAMQKEAYDAAHYVTFQTKLNKQQGNVLAKAGNLVQKFKAPGYFSFLKNYYLPFIQTPTNITTFVSQRTPILAQMLTSYNDDIAAGGARAQMAKTRLQLGSMFHLALMGTGYYGTRSGDFELGGSDINIKGKFSGAKSEMMKGIGYQPNSIRIPSADGKTWQINTTGLDPLNMMITSAANSGQYLNLMLNDTANYEDALAHTLAYTLGLGEMVVNSTYLQGLSNGYQDMQLLTKYATGDIQGINAAKQWSGRMASSFIPTGAKQIGKYFNTDYNKLATEYSEYFKRNIKEDNLEYDYNILGERIEKFGFLSSYQMTPVKEALLMTEPKIRPIKKSVQYNFDSLPGFQVSVPLNSSELRFLKKNSGLIFNDYMTNEVLPDPEYQRSIDEGDMMTARGIIKAALSQARSDAKALLLDPEQNPNFENLAARAEEAKTNKIISENRGRGLINDD